MKSGGRHNNKQAFCFRERGVEEMKGKEKKKKTERGRHEWKGKEENKVAHIHGSPWCPG